ncbi:large ribosomal subunit protein mL42 [Halichoeres trimaculatus]|uniref:large ribosomal subunit protein mL42 n=1 Tax=Halichoeres trimaculatus TaxID=147232 RepID=UPI003D9F27B4
MASGHFSKLHCLLTRLQNGNALLQTQTCWMSRRLKYSFGGHLIDKNSDVEVGVTSDGKTIVCHHPTVDIPYELTQPIEHPDALKNPAETHDQVLKAHLSMEVLKDKKGPSIEELSKMFYTTKHRWYPVGQYHTRRRKRDPPKDR